MNWQNITTLEIQKRNPRRVNVYLDGRFAFGLSATVVAEKGLQEGQRLSPTEVEVLLGAEEQWRVQDAALRFLSYRPRSEAEVRRRLQRGGFAPQLVEEVLAQLRGQGLLDDAAFATFWTQNRVAFRPRGARLVQAELRARGVDRETIQGATEGLDEAESAYRAAQKKARTLAADDYARFRRQLGAFLLRRGFGYEVAEQTVKRLWEEASKHLS